MVFALVAAAVMEKLAACKAAGQPWHAHGPTAVLTVGICLAGGLWLLATILRPTALLLIYRIVTAVSLPIGIVVSYAILAMLYFGIFTPISLAFRLLGRDALHRRFDASAKTYWAPRRPVGDVRRYFRQF